MWPFLLIGGAIFLLGSQTNKLINNLQYAPTRLQFLRSGLSINLKLWFTITNPDNTAANVDMLSGTILANGSQLGTFRSTGPITIKPNSTSETSCIISLDDIETATALYAIWKSGKTPVIDIKGNIQTAIATVPFTYNFLLAKDLKFRKK